MINSDNSPVKYRDKKANKKVKNLKILPVGDSLCQGIGSISGWRWSVYRELYAAGVTFEFVGPYNSAYDFRLPTRYNKHASESGRRIEQVTEKAAEVFGVDFDAVIMYIGYNNKTTIDKADVLYRELVDTLYKYNPTATVFCMEIGPDYNGGKEFVEFNKFLKSMCEEMKASGRDIYFVPFIRDKWDNQTCLYDYVHFNEVGDAMIGDSVARVAAPRLLEMNVPDEAYELPVTATGISLANADITLKKYPNYGESAMLGANVYPTDAEVRDVLYVSSDESVATVNLEGTVKAVGAGTCTVTALTLDGGIEAKCSVTVEAAEREETVLLDDDFRNGSHWVLGDFGEIIFEMMRFAYKTKNEIVTAKSVESYKPGNRFHLDFDMVVNEYARLLPIEKPDNYGSVSLGELEVRIHDNARVVSVMHNGKILCSYGTGHYEVRQVNYGVTYDCGKITLFYDGAPVAHAFAEISPIDAPIVVTDNEQSDSGKSIHIGSMKLVKF